MKGVVLAGGSGTRLYPITLAISKHLLPVYDKPLIYYSMSVLMMAGIRDILIISMPEDKHNFQRLFGDGSKFGLKISYAVQESPEGVAQAFLIAEDFLAGEPCALVYGDSVFCGRGFSEQLQDVAQRQAGAHIFGFRVKNPSDYGVIELDAAGKVVSVVEKPEQPASNLVTTGLFFYDGHVSEYAKTLRPSARGELEITDLNQIYLEKEQLNVTELGRGFAWFNSANPDNIFDAGEYIRVMQKNTGVRVGCIEEIAYTQGWINRAQLLMLADELANTDYGAYVESVALSNVGIA